MKTIAALFMTIILMQAISIPYSHALELPDNAFVLLAEAAAESCSICAEQKRQKAFDLLNEAFMPDRLMETDGTCLLVKMASDYYNDLSLSCYPPDAAVRSIPPQTPLPQLVFRFHTADRHLAGIPERDYTGAAAADVFLSSEPGTCYEGTISLIHYTYGDGLTFNYLRQTNTVLVHCRVEHLRPVRRP